MNLKGLMEIWQKDLFQNATQHDTSITVLKEKMVWPLIVLVVDRTAANDYKRDFNDDEIGEIERKYKLIINHQTMSYDVITRVLSGYKDARKSVKEFVEDSWREYSDIVANIDSDEKTKESIAKIVLYRILTHRHYIKRIKNGVNL